MDLLAHDATYLNFVWALLALVFDRGQSFRNPLLRRSLTGVTLLGPFKFLPSFFLLLSDLGLGLCSFQLQLLYHLLTGLFNTGLSVFGRELLSQYLRVSLEGLSQCFRLFKDRGLVDFLQLRCRRQFWCCIDRVLYFI